MKKAPPKYLSAVERIYQRYENFTESHKAIADFFLNNLEMATFKSLHELEALIGVSDATIVRFAYDLGYGTFKDFREHLAEYIRKIIYCKLPEAPGIRSGNSFERTVNADIMYVRQTMDAVDGVRFSRLVDMLCKAKSIYVMGWRISSFLAEFTVFQLQRIGYDARAIVRERRPILEQTAAIKPDDMLLVFDQIVYSAEVYDAVKYLATSRPDIPIVTVTSDPLAHIVQHASLSFFLDLCGQKAFSLISLTAPMCFINALAEAVFSQNVEQATTCLQRYEQLVWENSHYAMIAKPKTQRIRKTK